jgi:cardiolipin synthase C
MIGRASRGTRQNRVRRRTNAAHCSEAIPSRLERRRNIVVARMKTARTNEPEALTPGAIESAHGQVFARWFITAGVALAIAACATLPGSNYPKQASHALDRPEATSLGREIDAAARTHAGLSGFRFLASGEDGLRARVELADAAQKSLDLQYFLIQNDVTGKLLIGTVLRAADRGVHVRMLIDDTEDLARDKQITALAAHRGIEIRIFNPYYARGAFNVFRYGEFLVDRRLNYRMHNKVFVADNAAAILGGRNIGDEYFAASAHIERGDFDVLAMGPIVRRISTTFDAYWNSDLAIPIEALLAAKPGNEALEAYRAELEQNRKNAQTSARVPDLATADPVHALLDGDGALVWSKAEVLYDNPDKSKVESGEKDGPLLRERLAQALDKVDGELLIVSPYLVPANDGMRLLEQLRSRGVRVRIVTNSLASTDFPAVHSGYEHYRTRMLDDGVELYEVRPAPEATDDHGQSLKSPSSGQFSMHAKLFVFDRQRVFVGSMNFDYRSLRLNTEIGLLIESPVLAKQASERFDAIAQPANCYIPHLAAPDAFGHRQIAWRTEENGKTVELTTEPSGTLVRGLQASLLTLLPLDDLL